MSAVFVVDGLSVWRLHASFPRKMRHESMSGTRPAQQCFLDGVRFVVTVREGPRLWWRHSIVEHVPNLSGTRLLRDFVKSFQIEVVVSSLLLVGHLWTLARTLAMKASSHPQPLLPSMCHTKKNVILPQRRSEGCVLPSLAVG